MTPDEVKQVLQDERAKGAVEYLAIALDLGRKARNHVLHAAGYLREVGECRMPGDFSAVAGQLEGIAKDMLDNQVGIENEANGLHQWRRDHGEDR